MALSNRRNFKQWFQFILVIVLILSGCDNNPTPTGTSEGIAEYSPPPTPANNLEQLIVDLSSEDPEVRVVSAYALDKYGKDAVAAIPALIKNLDYDGYYEVRKSALAALSEFGPSAHEAITKTISIVRNDEEAYPVRDEAVIALGKYGDKSAVPVLVSLLYIEDEEYKVLAANSARSIAAITSVKFIDSDGYGFTGDENGNLLIVKDARKWWEEKGQYLEW